VNTALGDAEARRRITENTHETLFVEAGAGSGKTNSLVNRITRLVLTDGVALRGIAAVTFTEKAGAELRDRLRAALEEHSGERAERALEDLDSAAIGTLHSFAQRILAEHPIEAGLPPLIEVADELSSAVAFEERWSVQRRQLLDDDTAAEALLLAMSAGLTLEHLRSLSRLFGADWDLLGERVLTGAEPGPAQLRGMDTLIATAAALAARAVECADANDKFLSDLTAFGTWAEELGAATDAGRQLEVLLTAETLRARYGKGGNWGGKDALTALKGDCQQLQADAAHAVADVVELTLRSLSRWVARRVLDAADARRTAGRLEFHDLLVLARTVLRRDPGVRAALHQRYPVLLLDEFQDTDPIQIELAVRIAGGADAVQQRWEDVVVPPGSLFVVGDPKQSIYRFRRADIAMYLRSQDVIGEHVTLSTNFRTVAPVVSWVNTVFSRLITAEPDAQPEYRALSPHRAAPPGGPAVGVLGAEGHPGRPKAAELRTQEAADVAATVARALTEQWPVCENGAWRPARLDDIAVLVPARTSLPFLENALNTANIAYRAEASSLVYEAQEVRDLLAASRAVADPSDRLALVTALRCPLYGCGDDDLWTWKRDGGALSILAPPNTDRADHPVATALAHLRGLHQQSRWWAPSELLAAIVADRRVLEVAATDPRARDQWRRIRFVLDQARAWSESEHGGLRAYLAWAAQQGAETSRVVEAALPETDASTLRIMTVHAAKGLEFPIVVLSGMTAAPRTATGVRVLWPRQGGYAVSLRKGVTTGDFATAAPIDEQMDDRERRRLLYVAATRARDHLVVSLHRGLDSTTNTSATLLATTGHAALGAQAWTPPENPPAPPASQQQSPVTPPEYAAWLKELTRIRQASARPATESASGLEGSEPAIALVETAPAGSAKGPVDVDLPPWSKGRDGTAVGRAVHGVLQSINLAADTDVEAAVTAQCAAESVQHHRTVVTGLVRSALRSDMVQRAGARSHWREIYVASTQADGTIIEGFIDLLYREDDGTLVIIDYKTDAVPAAAIPARATYYQPQLHAYITMLHAATGAADIRAVLLFLHPERTAVRVPLPPLPPPPDTPP